ncbi:transposase [Streptomyces swartbergensis]|uniref:Transposase n=1 Tax=Streptomyces swartbergensis TaxID=487165 RepID=A0A243S9F1_9ACTN|nr:winged helix-turn-helix domain-containing protein [Streptomyces swartbergensis]OUD04248.1 transposase [Streptomyces swartbergensis]
MEAAERFRRGDENTVIARDLRVSVWSVQRWRRAWSQDGPRALASKGPASLPLLSDELFAVLERELDKGPVAHGWPEQTWTLSRIRTLIGRRFHKRCTVQGVAALLKRHGWSCQVPARRAIERDENLVAGWMKETWPQVEGPWRRSTSGSSSRTKPDSR